MPSFGESSSSFGSDVWQRRPDFIDLDEEATNGNGPGSVHEVGDSSFAVREIQIINYEELEFEHGEHHEVGMGAARLGTHT
jgi:hypothetical protein